MEPFVYLPKYRVVVCTKCRYGMSAGGVRTHLAGKRHIGVLDEEERSTIVKTISQIAGIIQDEQELDEFQFPSPTSSAIPELAEPKNDGMRCKTCQYVSRHRQGIQVHCQRRHGWRNQRKKGRRVKVPQGDLPWDSGIRCQRFFQTRVNSRWFEVDRNKEGDWIEGGMELVESDEDEEDGRSGEEMEEIEDSEGAVLIESSPGGSGSGIVMGSSPPEFDESSPGGSGSGIVIGSSPPEFDGLGIGTQSEESDMQLPGRIETSSQTVVGSQTVPDLNRQGVRQTIVARTAKRPIPYQADPSRGYTPREVVELIEYLEYWSEVFPLCPLCHLMEDKSDPQHPIEGCWREKSREIGRAIQAMERGMRAGAAYARDGCCPECGVPRILDADLAGHQDAKGRGRCKYEGVLVRGFVTMYIAGFPDGITILDNWLDRNLINRGDGDAAMAWFRAWVPWGGMKVVQVLQVFYMLSKKNVGFRYRGQYNMGVESIEQVEWIWRRYLELEEARGKQ
jgi:hypothetical protein